MQVNECVEGTEYTHSSWSWKGWSTTNKEDASQIRHCKAFAEFVGLPHLKEGEVFFPH